jgi:tetratricopeptide (TPR) repeat protein
MLCFSRRSICFLALGFAQLTCAAQQSYPPQKAAATPVAVVSPPVRPISTELRGDIMMAEKRYMKAIEWYQMGDSHSALLANKIGIAYHQMHLLALAKKKYQQAIKLNPKYADAINNLGTIYYSEKRYRQATNYYRRAMHCSPSPSATIAANIGSAYFARKKYGDAAEWYEKAVRIDPDIFERHSSAGTIMRERTIEERALFHLSLAKTYAKYGINDRALAYLRLALNEGVKNPGKIPTMPEFAGLRKDLRFQQMMALQN